MAKKTSRTSSNAVLNGNGDNKNKWKNWLDTKTLFVPRNERQREVLQTINQNKVTIISGPAGTGKTFLAVMYGLNEFLKGKYQKLVFTRPCVEAYGERLGYLPGAYNDKISPYMIPIFCIIEEAIGIEHLNELINENYIVTLPLAFQRGVSFKNSFVLLDEAQNTIASQMRMFLTRLCEGSKMVVTGDPYQTDLSINNGLGDALIRLKGVPGLSVMEFQKEHIVRDPIVEKIEERYQKD